ncbi:MAG: hypothetical protein MHM6MM_000040 [Cercozoa sp. M6MM]
MEPGLSHLLWLGGGIFVFRVLQHLREHTEWPLALVFGGNLAVPWREMVDAHRFDEGDTGLAIETQNRAAELAFAVFFAALTAAVLEPARVLRKRLRNRKYAVIVVGGFVWLLSSLVSLLRVFRSKWQASLALMPYAWLGSFVALCTCAAVIKTVLVVLGGRRVVRFGTIRRLVEFWVLGMCLAIVSTAFVTFCGFSARHAHSECGPAATWLMGLPARFSKMSGKDAEIPPVVSLWMSLMTVALTHFVFESQRKSRAPVTVVAPAVPIESAADVEEEITVESLRTHLPDEPESSLREKNRLLQRVKQLPPVLRRYFLFRNPPVMSKMVPWYSMVQAATLVDIGLSMTFLSRFDLRELQILHNDERGGRGRTNDSRSPQFRNQQRERVESTEAEAPLRRLASAPSSPSSRSSTLRSLSNGPADEDSLTLTPPINKNILDLSNRASPPSPRATDDTLISSPSARNDESFWFDFVADVGDGFNSSYAVARLLAAPRLTLKRRFREKGSFAALFLPSRHKHKRQEVPEEEENANDRLVTLKRGTLLLIGGDLAYPSPTLACFQKKFLRVFEEALPSPPFGLSDKLVVGTADTDTRHADSGSDTDADTLVFDTAEEDDNEAYLATSDAAWQPDFSFETMEINSTDAPVALAVPGNHDYYDGGVTFRQCLCHRSWMGGWLLPQKRTFWATKLPRNWWILGFDLGLSADIDSLQWRFFERVLEDVPPDAAVIAVHHEPDWLLADYESRRDTPQKSASAICRRLNVFLRRHVRHRLRLRLAGDLHCYMRHVPEDSVRDDVVDSAHPTLVLSGGGGAFMHPTHITGGPGIRHQGVEYRRVRAYPDERTSRVLSVLNLVDFRARNVRFDMGGAVLYALVAASFLPACDLGADWNDFAQGFSLAHLVTRVVRRTLRLCLLALQWAPGARASAVAAAAAFVVLLGVAEAPSLAACARLLPRPLHAPMRAMGPQGRRAVLALCHAAAHVVAAFGCAAVVDEVARAIVGYGLVAPQSALYDAFEESFGVIAQVVRRLDTVSLGLPSMLLRLSFSVADVADTAVRARSAVCEAATAQSTLIFVATAMPFFALLAVPAASTVLGTYLYIAANYLHTHMTESFSSLRIEDLKNFTRMRIDSRGDLHVYVVGIDRVAKAWRRTRGSDLLLLLRSTLSSVGASWTWRRPSLWQPAPGQPSDQEVFVIDEFVVRRQASSRAEAAP